MVLSRDEDEAHHDWMLCTPPLVAQHHVLMLVFSDAARHTLGCLRFRHISRLSGWDGYTTLVVEIIILPFSILFVIAPLGLLKLILYINPLIVFFLVSHLCTLMFLNRV